MRNSWSAPPMRACVHSSPDIPSVCESVPRHQSCVGLTLSPNCDDGHLTDRAGVDHDQSRCLSDWISVLSVKPVFYAANDRMLAEPVGSVGQIPRQRVVCVVKPGELLAKDLDLRGNIRFLDYRAPKTPCSRHRVPRLFSRCDYLAGPFPVVISDLAL